MHAAFSALPTCRRWLSAACAVIALTAASPCWPASPHPALPGLPRWPQTPQTPPQSQQQVRIGDFSVVELRSRALPDARLSELGATRQGGGVELQLNVLQGMDVRTITVETADREQYLRQPRTY